MQRAFLSGAWKRVDMSRDRKLLMLRAIAIGVFLSLFISIAGPYADCFIQGSAPMLTSLPLIAVFLLFLLVLLVNVPLNRLGIGLKKEELLIIFVMMLVACAIPTMGLVEQLLPILAGSKYYATPANHWAEMIHPHIPEWLVPQDTEAVRSFFEGLPKGGKIPWGAWKMPLISWLSFVLALYGVMYSIMVIIRKQWMEKERLMYPLMQLPNEMAENPEKGSLVNQLFKNKLLWIGFLIPVVISTTNGLHAYFHFIPEITLRNSVPILRNTTSLVFYISFSVIGISYLLTTGLSLSLWLFAVLGAVQTGIFRMIGYSIGSREAYCASSPSVSHQGFGAMIVLVAVMLWAARHHLKDVFRKAFTGDKNIDDSDEALSYRTSVVVLILGLLFMIGWLIATGLPIHTTLILIISAFVVFLALTRVIIQGGVIVVKSPLTPQVFTVSALGSNAIGVTGLAALAYTFVWCADLKVFLMPYVAHSFKLVEAIKTNKKLITFAILIAILISLAGSIYTVMHLSYTHGGANLNGWYYISCPQVPFKYIAEKINHPVGISWKRLMFTGIGGLVMAGLIFMKNNILWWPIHPLGFVVGNTLPLYSIWFSIFLAWLIKVVILKYGGVKIYKKTRYFFMGLVLGQFAIAGIWLVIDFITGMQGNALYLF